MRLKFPTPYTVLILIIVICAGLTFVLPSGSYNTLQYAPEKNEFVITSPDSVYSVKATQSFLNEKGVRIDIQKFKEGKIKKTISIPNTYRQGEAKPQGVSAILFAPIKGIYEAIDVILFVLILGGFIGIFNSSGTLDKGVSYLAYRLKGREKILIIIVTTLISLGGSTFGLAEETLAFYPILIPVFLAAGYDAMVPLAVIYLGSAVGSMASTVNPFAVIIASDAVGVDWTTGLSTRLILLVLCTIITIIYIVRYAEKVRKNPALSVGFSSEKNLLKKQEIQQVTSLSVATKGQLLIFALSFVVMIFGVAKLGWWFEEMTGLFLVASVCIALVQRTSEAKFIEYFLAGTKDLLGVAFIIGIARGVTFILNDGQISDTILHHSTNLVSGMSPVLLLPILTIVFAVLTIFISSSSGMAVVTMPIMGAIATAVGVSGQGVVNTYLIGMGLMSFIAPTGLILPSLEMVNLNYKHWLKFVTPLLLILTFVSVAILLLEHMLGF